MCRCVCYEFFFCNLLQNRSQNCRCPWDRHVRRLYLRDDPKSHFKEDWTILFHTNKLVGIFFGRFRFFRSFLFVASFASKCKLLNKDQSDFYHKDLVRVHQKQNLALSWFKPARTFKLKIRVLVQVWERPWTVAAQKIFKNLRGQGFPYRVAKLFYSRECFYFLRINVFPNLHRHLNFVVVVLMVLSNVKAWTQWSIVRSKFTSFLALRLLLAIC